MFRSRLSAAYKHADGKKIDGKRVLVDVERARTVKGWLPRRLGGGLGGTRRGGADVNIKHSGREDNERERERYRLEREREERGLTALPTPRGDRDRSERPFERRRSRSRERRRRSRSRSPRKEKRRRSKERIRDDEEPDRRERDRDRDRDRKRRRSRSKDKDRETRKRERRERREREREKGEKLEYIKTDEGGEVRIKEEPVDDYDYAGFAQAYSQANVKFEEDEEQKYQPDKEHSNGASRYQDEEYEEGEAY